MRVFNVGLVNLIDNPHALLGGNRNNVSQVGEMNEPVKGRDGSMNSNPEVILCDCRDFERQRPAGFAQTAAAGTEHRSLRLDSRDHRDGPAAHGEHPGRADLDSGVHGRDAEAAQRHDLRRLHQVSAQRVGGDQRPGSGQHLHARPERRRTAGSQGSGSTGCFPNVAIYLDDQSGQLPARNLDIYAADLERIEVLEGPQGTLFGAGAQAGVVRYITNKPKLDVTEGNVEAGYGTTAHGDPNSNV